LPGSGSIVNPELAHSSAAPQVDPASTAEQAHHRTACRPSALRRPGPRRLQPRICSLVTARHVIAMSQQHDDDGTVIRPASLASAVTPGSAPAGQTGGETPSDIAEDGLSLRVGARLGEFEITQRIGEGGFSIVYLAMDHSLERTVALKEYLPSSLATRVGSTQVQPRSQRYRDTFEAGLKSFVNEAKLLAQFDHPSLVKVYRFWEANGTAYMVMPFYQGATVKETVRAMPRPPDEDWLLMLLGPLTEALLVIHAEHCYHRDIAPDNVILLANSAKPLLLDFGAARRVIGDMTQGLTVILKAGYAPVEQYAEIPGMKQGPWTDVYALAAVVYWAITGSTPPASVGRMLSDSFVPLARCAAGRYSKRFLETIDRALLVRPEQRTQTIDAFRAELGLTGAGGARTPLHHEDTDATVIRPVGHGPAQNARSDPATSGPTVERTHAESPRVSATPSAVEASAREDRDPGVPHRQPPLEDAASRTATDVDRSRSRGPRWLLAGSAVGALTVAAAIWWALQSPTAEPSRPVQQQAPAIAAEIRPGATPDVASAPGAAVPAPDARLASPSTPETAPPAAPPVAAEAVKPIPEPTPSTVESAPAMPPRAESVPSTAPPVEAIPVTAPPPVEPVPAAPTPPAAARRAAPRDAVTAPAARAERAAPRAADGARHERVQAESANAAECARIVQRLSLGESSRELLERLKVLKCQ
jgi:serine/threonine protein kinase